jgi:hypothetical protein
LPTIEYRNKTWSNLDLAQSIKKDVIRALISHTGAIIGNKFSKHRPNTAQQNRLRELASSSVVLASTPLDTSRDNSDTSSALARSDRSRSPRRSFASDRNLTRTPSASSSFVSLPSDGQKSLPLGLHMTPAKKQRPESITDSETTRNRGIKTGLDFVHRLTKKDKDSSTPSSNGQDDSEESSKKRSKSLKTIISGLSS